MILRPSRWARDLEIVRPFTGQFSSLQKEMNKLMDTFFADYDGSPTTAAFVPPVDLAEGDKDFQVSVELPGLTDKDIDVVFEKGVLRIKGEKKSEHEESGKNFHRLERTYGSFYRAIPFSTEIDESKIEANFDKGILHIKLPKAAAALKEAKKIQVKTS